MYVSNQLYAANSALSVLIDHDPVARLNELIANSVFGITLLSYIICFYSWQVV